MPQVTAEITTSAAVAPGGTIDVPFPSGYAQADFLVGGLASTSVFGADYDDLAVTFDADSATVTWPSGNATTIPAGTEMTFGLPLVKEISSERLIDLLPNQADSVAADVATLVTDFNALLDKLKAARLMEAD